MAQPIPDGMEGVSIYLVVRDAKAAVDFYVKAFGAQPGMFTYMPDGKTPMHAEFHLKGSTVMLSQENPDWNVKSAETLGGSPISMHLYFEDCDAAFKRAVDAGCEVVSPLTDMFWGDRFGKVRDPFGLEWGLATHKEDVDAAEMERRAATFFAEMGGGEA